jgi:organic radical activating enzyme
MNHLISAITEELASYLEDPFDLPYSGENSHALAARCLKDIKNEKYRPSFYSYSLLLRNRSSSSKKDMISLILQRYRYDIINQKGLDPDGKNQYPVAIQIEITSRCNYRCKFCYQTDATFSSKESKYQGDISYVNWTRLIDECCGSIPFLIIASRGEPTLHPEFSEIISYAKGKFLDFKLNTNASLLNEQSIHSILDACTTVHFSIDSADKKGYEYLRVNGKLENVLKRIHLFNERRKHHPRKDIIRTHASGVRYDPLIQNEQEHRSVLESYVDGSSFVPYTPWDSSYTNPANSLTTPCNLLRLQQYVWFDCTYGACDIDYKNNLINSNNAVDLSTGIGLRSAWNSPEMVAVRNKHNQGGRQCLNPCSGCTYE